MRRVAFLAVLAACSSPAAKPAPDATSAVAPVATSTETLQQQRAPTFVTSSALAEKMDAARAQLEGFVREPTSDPATPWALAHGLLAFGPDLVASDGRKAIDAIVGDAAEVVIGADKKQKVRFPPRTKSGGIVDAHSNLMVKKMIESGVPWDREFTVKPIGKVTLERLARDAVDGFRAPNDEKTWADAPWTVIVALRLAKHEKKLDPAVERQLKGLALETLAQLESQQDFLDVLLQKQRPDLVEKKKQKIYAHPCGGLHFVQAALYSAWFIGDASAYAKARHQLEIVMFRWMAEREIYRKTALAQPQYALLIRTQELKFYGHILEVFALAKELGIVAAEPELLVPLGGVAQDLIRTIEVLAPAYGHLGELKAGAPQTYLDLVGDGDHAVHGLREGVVAFFRPQ